MTAVDDRTESHVRAVLRAVAEATTIPERPGLGTTTPLRLAGDLDGTRRDRRRPPRSRAGRRLTAAAIAAAVVVLAGTAVLLGGDGGPDTETGSSSPTASVTEPRGFRGSMYGLDHADLPAGFLTAESTADDVNHRWAAPLDADIYALDGGGVAAVVTGPAAQLAEALDDDFGAADDVDGTNEEIPLSNGTTAVVVGTDKEDWVELAVRGDGRWLGAIRANRATVDEVLPLAEHLADPAGDRPGQLVESTTTHALASGSDRVGAMMTYAKPASASGPVTTGDITVRTEVGIGLDPLVRHLADEEVDIAGHPGYLTSSAGEIWVTWEPEPGIVVTLGAWAWGQEGLDADAVVDLAGKVLPVVTTAVPQSEEDEPGG